MTRSLPRRLTIISSGLIVISVALLAAAQAQRARRDAAAGQQVRSSTTLPANADTTSRISLGRVSHKSLDEKARLMGIKRTDLSTPFTVSARQPYVAGRAALYTKRADLDAINDNIFAYAHGPGEGWAYIVIELNNLVRDRKLLAECHVTSKMGGDLRMQIAGGGSSLGMTHQLARNKPTTVPFVIDAKDRTMRVVLDVSKGSDWGLGSCTFTPQK